MTDTTNTPTDGTVLSAPDITLDVRETFGIDIDMKVPAFSRPDARTPDIDEAYVFDADTTLAILAGFAFNRRVIVQGYHGTGKSTLMRTSAGSIWSAAMRSCCAMGCR
jgi:cobaltochelatase CobS